MIDFEYYNPAKILFGVNSIDSLEAELVANNAHSVLMVYSGEFVKELGIYDAVKDITAKLGIGFIENGHVVPNPSVELVRELIVQGREANVDFILAVGGGSSIDTAKAISIGIPYDGDVWDFFEAGTVPQQVLPIGVIATTASSGSETSNAAIISNGNWKLGFEDNRIIPKFAIMNPVYTLGLPKYQTAVGIADILSHLLERYFSDTTDSDTTDYLIEGAIKALLVNANRIIELYRENSVEELQDSREYLDAKAQIQWLATVAHNNFLDAGRRADWASHRIEHELSAEYNITHGEGMAVVLLAWIRYMAHEKPWRPALLASRIFGADSYDYDQRQQALILADRFEELFKSLEIATSLENLNIDDSRFEIMAKRATRNGAVGHYLPIDEARFVDILKLA
ncbi:MAG: iron-containing alcohol dehydrogenase [Lachnospiraceae bacterium]|nr:iron-containing alcohol dehydrogenase [Lachnospiraceae bacterium]